MPEQTSLDFDSKQTNQTYPFVLNCSDFDRSRTALLEFHRLTSVVGSVEEGGKSVQEGTWR